MAVPNAYHLNGGGITLTYFPDGDGPVRQGGGRFCFGYQDAHMSKSFSTDEVRLNTKNDNGDDDDLGTEVSVTLIPTVDIGYTSFSVLIPTVTLPETPFPSVAIQTVAITTVHRIFAGAIGHPQTETYTVTHLSGTAGIVLMAL